MQTSSRKIRSRRPAKAAESRNGHRRWTRSASRSKLKTSKLGAVAVHGNGVHNSAFVAQPDPRAKAAVKLFAEATRYFNRQNFSRAKGIFEKVSAEAPSDIAARARVHVSLCEQKLSKPAPVPKTAAEYYNLGVAELNARNIDQALLYLSKADKSAPKHDEVQYALAAIRSIQGNADAAIQHLKTAITMRPGNRYLAQRDEDFESLRSDPRFRSLMHPESNSNLQYSS
jgi:tetratricopeptide (TPR) repeat protein